MSSVAPDIHHLSGAHMKGFAVLNLIAYIKESYGTPALERFYGELPASQSGPLRNGSIVSVGWVPLELYSAGVQFLVKHFHGGIATAARKIGHDLASKDITANEIAGSLLAWLEHSRARNVRLLELGPGGPDSIRLDIAFE
jgi:hypothetical protein